MRWRRVACHYRDILLVSSWLNTSTMQLVTHPSVVYMIEYHPSNLLLVPSCTHPNYAILSHRLFLTYAIS